MSWGARSSVADRSFGRCRRPPPEEDKPETWGDKPTFAAAFDGWAALWQPRLPAPTAKACIPLEPADGDAMRRQKQLELFRRSVAHIRARDEAARLQVGYVTVT